MEGNNYREDLQDTEGRRALLASKREHGEIAQSDYDLHYLWHIRDSDSELTATDLKHYASLGEALVLSSTDFKQLGVLKIKYKTGEIMVLDPDDFETVDELIIFPEDLG